MQIHMKNTKDLNWLSAPHSFNPGHDCVESKKLPRNNGQQAEIQPAVTALSISK
jgi:hypothetical protein